MQNTEFDESCCPFDIDANANDLLGDERLRDVRSIAKRIHNRLPAHVPLDDLVQAGVIGLIDAANKYDPARGTQFRSYAHFRIHGAIIDSLRDMDWLPRRLRRQSRKLEETRHRLSGRLCRSPSESEIADDMGLDLPSLQVLLAEIDALQVNRTDWESVELQADSDKVVHKERPSDPFQRVLQAETKSLLSSMIAELSPLEQRVIALYYFEERPLAEIGWTMKLSPSWVSRICTRAVRRLRLRFEQMAESNFAQPNDR